MATTSRPAEFWAPRFSIVWRTAAEFKEAGKLILGICNGFQILMKSGVLLAAEGNAPPATLTWNESGRFEDRWVHLQSGGSKWVFFAGIETMDLPVAHAEGKFVTRDAAVLAELERGGQVVLRYRASGGASEVGYPDNPNGAQANIAGICDPSGRVCGLMPHPERHIEADAASAVDPRPSSGRGRWAARVPECRRLFSLAAVTFKTHRLLAAGRLGRHHRRAARHAVDHTRAHRAAAARIATAGGRSAAFLMPRSP